MHATRAGRWLRWGSLALYLLALAGPGFHFGEQRQAWDAYLLLLIGWLGPFDGHFAWFANPAFLIGQLTWRVPVVCRVVSVAALLLALSFLLHREIVVSEAPTYAKITGYGWGYVVWLLAMACLALGSFLPRGLNLRRSRS